MKTTITFDHAIHDRVKLLAIDRPGLVDAVMMENHEAQYRVAYWNDGDRKTTWVYASEIAPEQKKP